MYSFLGKSYFHRDLYTGFYGPGPGQGHGQDQGQDKGRCQDRCQDHGRGQVQVQDLDQGQDQDQRTRVGAKARGTLTWTVQCVLHLKFNAFNSTPTGKCIELQLEIKLEIKSKGGCKTYAMY